jgi:hypothetical protein
LLEIIADSSTVIDSIGMGAFLNCSSLVSQNQVAIADSNLTEVGH